MWKLFPHACGKRCHNSPHMCVSGVVDATNLPTGLWEDLQLCLQGLLAEMWQLIQPVGHPYSHNEIPLQPIVIVWILLVNKT
jgi:hypothetical protein